ncbi:MAG: Holliday junction resolvase RuvX [Tepidiformaceae bacterium]
MAQPLPRSQPQHPHRLLALDAGERRIGVAVSDELGLFAHVRPAIVLGRGVDAVQEVARIVDAEAVAEVVVGLPLSLSGADSEQTASARTFARQLRDHLAIPVTEWDERLSSVEASRTMGGTLRRADVSSRAGRTVTGSVRHRSGGSEANSGDGVRSSSGAAGRRSGKLDSASAGIVLQAVLDARRAKADR